LETKSITLRYIIDLNYIIQLKINRI